MKKLLKSLGILGVVVPVASQAAVPVGVSTALGDLLSDSTTVAGLTFAVFVAILAFAYYRKAAK